MKIKIIFSCLLWFQITQAVIFTGLIETGVSKNNFLCSSTASNCNSADANAKNFDFSTYPMLQLFNDQTYWLHQASTHAQYVSEVLSYSGTDLQDKMISDGWGAMGSYCILISTDPILTNVVMPTVTASAGQEKVVVQLWYNGDQVLQLWSQDAITLSPAQTFTITISTDTDPLPGVTTSSQNSSSSLTTNFLSNLQLQQKNRKESVYQNATQSPRSITIQGS